MDEREMGSIRSGVYYTHYGATGPSGPSVPLPYDIRLRNVHPDVFQNAILISQWDEITAEFCIGVDDLIKEIVDRVVSYQADAIIIGRMLNVGILEVLKYYNPEEMEYAHVYVYFFLYQLAKGMSLDMSTGGMKIIEFLNTADYSKIHHTSVSLALDYCSTKEEFHGRRIGF